MSELRAIRPAAMRQAATRCFPPLTGNAAIPYLRAITEHKARRRLVNPRVVYPNWRMNGASEVAGYGAGTIKVALEYPAGVFTLANECIAAGNAAIAFPVGNTTLTFNVAVPRKASFWLRPLVTIPAGVNWIQVAGGTQSAYGTGPNDYMDISTNPVADHTNGGTVGAANGSLFFPIVIASEHREAAPIIFGTSRAAGGTYINDTSLDAGPECMILGKNHGYTNTGIAATLLSQWNAGSHSYLGELIAAGYWTHAINEYGINDTGDTATVLAGRRATFATWLKGLRSDIILIGETIYPRTNSTDEFSSKTNQTLSVQPIPEFNNLVRAGIAGEDYCWDAASGVDPGRTGRYPATQDTAVEGYTRTLFTAGLSGTTLTVSAVTSGPALGPGDSLSAAGAAPNLWIKRQLTGTTGGIGTYEVNRTHGGFPWVANIAAGTAFSTGGRISRDGLHLETPGVDTLVRNAGHALLDLLAA